MVDFLALMIKIGRITLEQVPSKYLTEVTDLLNLDREEEN